MVWTASSARAASASAAQEGHLPCILLTPPAPDLSRSALPLPIVASTFCHRVHGIPRLWGHRRSTGFHLLPELLSALRRHALARPLLRLARMFRLLPRARALRTFPLLSAVPIIVLEHHRLSPVPSRSDFGWGYPRSPAPADRATMPSAVDNGKSGVLRCQGDVSG